MLENLLKYLGFAIAAKSEIIKKNLYYLYIFR